jgi:hypothetical protein
MATKVRIVGNPKKENRNDPRGLPFPTKFCIKVNPPKLAVIYKFDNKGKSYCHDVNLQDLASN